MAFAADFPLFTDYGLSFLSRWGHVVVGITWIGLLYYFNVVQVPAFAEFDANSRNVAVDKLANRALWWFRWSALATFVMGVLILWFQDQLSELDYWKSLPGMSISIGVLLGTTMLLNVWAVIWPRQKVVIANARNVVAGGEADPNAAAAGRRALLASRQNMIFSLPMLWFMVGTSHFYGGPGFEVLPGSGARTGFYLITVVIWGLLELNCLGYLGGTGAGPLRWMYESHKNAITSGVVLLVIFFVLTYGFFKV